MQIGVGSLAEAAGQQSAVVVHFSLILAHFGTSQVHAPVAAPSAAKQ
jgi:hypothetical protein